MIDQALAELIGGPLHGQYVGITAVTDDPLDFSKPRPGIIPCAPEVTYLIVGRTPDGMLVAVAE